MLRGFLSSLLTFLRDSFTDNIGLKALAMCFALGLFAFVHGQEEEQQRTVPVALVMRLPQGSAQRELMTPIPASIHVTLQGSARAIDALIQDGIPPVEIDLRDGRRESVVFDESMFTLPPETKITIIDPSSIELDWEDVATRQIPIQAAITGQPADGYVVKGEPEVEPKTITVSGPISAIEVLQFARLQAFDVSGLSEGVHRRRLGIDAPPVRVRYLGPQAANVAVAVARRVSEVRFENRPVEVVGMPGGIATPRTVDVVVAGPPEIVRALRPEQIVPVADLTKVEGLDLTKHGSRTIKVTLSLSHAEAELQPPSVSVKW
ncbi:MAG TPA: CdaR family protein [Polyangiaceae bacterium]|nr:CdaR family protein [Polyangiaceae bacterium]